MKQDDPKRALKAELAAARIDFHMLLDSVSEEDWRARSNNPGWTNGEILFHILFAFMLMPMLAPLLRVVARLPKRYSKRFAAILNRSAWVFNRANAFGARTGAKVYTRERIGRKYDRVHAAILRTIDTMPEEEWDRGMYYPTRWDGLFSDYMTLENLLCYPIRHLRFHSNQLRDHRP